MTGWSRVGLTVLLVLLGALALTACGATDGATSRDLRPSSPSVSNADGAAASPSSGPTKDVSSIVGIWRFDALTGVPPSQLPSGAMADNRQDIVIRDDGSFRWGRWSGSVEGSGRVFAFLITRPARLRENLEYWGANVGIWRTNEKLWIWFPDLGQDRDFDQGEAVREDIDPPDMRFRRVGSIDRRSRISRSASAVGWALLQPSRG